MRKYFVGIGCICLILIACGLWFFLAWANSPVKQSASVLDTASRGEVGEQVVGTAFYSTLVPADFRVQSTENPNNPNMLHLTAFESHGNGLQVGITTSLLPRDGLNGIADYLFRIRNTDRYEPLSDSPFVSSGQSFKSKTNDAELTTFVIHGDRYASIVVSGSASDESEILAVYELVAKSWKWL